MRGHVTIWLKAHSKNKAIDSCEVKIVGTRLLSEAIIRRHHPHIRYVRVHTSGRNAAVIYAWNERLELPESDRVRLRRFAAGYLPPYLCCQVKDYGEVRTDQVPRVPEELPEPVMRAAMDRELTPAAAIGLINGMLTDGELAFDRYDDRTGTMHFAIRSGGAVTGIERELIRQYLYEIVPLGALFEVTYN